MNKNLKTSKGPLRPKLHGIHSSSSGQNCQLSSKGPAPVPDLGTQAVKVNPHLGINNPFALTNGYFSPQVGFQNHVWNEEATTSSGKGETVALLGCDNS